LRENFLSPPLLFAFLLGQKTGPFFPVSVRCPKTTAQQLLPSSRHICFSAEVFRDMFGGTERAGFSHYAPFLRRVMTVLFLLDDAD